MGIKSVIAGIFSSGAKDLADSAFKGLDSLITSKEELGAQQIALSDIKAELAKSTMDHSLKMKEIEFQLTEQEFEDRASAREMQTKTNSKIPGALAIFFTAVYFLETIGFLALIFSMIDIEIPQYAVMFISSLWGATSAIEVQIISFYFGSSKGSEDQSSRMGEAVQQAASGK